MLICIACLLAVVMVFLMHQNPNKGVQCIMFSKNLKTLRKQKGFSQEELAEKVDISWRHLQRLEHNESKTTVKTLKKLIKVLKISDTDIIKYLKTNENETENEEKE